MKTALKLNLNLAAARSSEIVLGLLIVLGATSAMASIPDTTQLTCDDARQVVQQSGVINMTSGSAGHTRFTADHKGSWCFSNEEAVQAWAPTLDAPTCAVGFVCVDEGRAGRALTADARN